MRLLRACWSLAVLSLRRQWWSVQTLMLLAPIIGCGLFVWGMRYAEQPDSGMVQRMLRRRGQQLSAEQIADSQKIALAAQNVIHRRTTLEEVERELGPEQTAHVKTAAARVFTRFSEEFVLGLYASFLLPIITLAYATTSLGGDREDRTLLFLLIRPIPRSCLLLTKAAATLPLVLGVALGSFWVYCRLAGPPGAQAWQAYAGAVTYSALAYVGLFHLFAVVFRHSTIMALVYALFVETFVGNMPGIVKQAAVNYYGRSMMLELGGLSPPENWFSPVSALAGAWTLWGVAAGTMLLAVALFQTREYRDLT